MRCLSHSILPAALTALLAGCTAAPSLPAPTRRPVVPHIAQPAPPVVAAPTPKIAMPAADEGDIWAQLRNGFAMSDCEADPGITSWARKYTRDASHFETQMREALPRIAYVQQAANEHGVASEFALLPWVESQFHPVHGHRNRPAGMWQIMPATAQSMGLSVNQRYDGRLNDQTATEAVMKTLRRFQDEFKDWRVTDYAYNAGESSVRQMVDAKGAPAATPVIPKLPVARHTREHLTKLLAIACVVREPERFGVSLPSLPAGQQLVPVKVRQSMPLSTVASQAGMSVDAVQNANAAFRNGVIDQRDSTHVLLPKAHAEQFRNAPSDPSGGDQAHSDAVVTPPMSTPVADAEEKGNSAQAPRPDAPASDAPKPRVHKVRSGETLWEIARRYRVDVRDLQRWNHLRGGKINPGLTLKLAAPG